MRLDQYLVQQTGLSRQKIQRIIEKGLVSINGSPIQKSSHKISGSEKIDYEIPPEEKGILQPAPIPINVLYEDEFLAVIDKTAGMVVHPGAGHIEGTLVQA